MNQIFSEAVQLLTSVKSAAIVVSDVRNIDAVNAAVSLYLTLTKLGVQTALTSTKPILPEISSYAQSFSDKLGGSGNNLIISFPYSEGAIEKVDYAIQGNTFNLIIIPQSEEQKINAQDVRFTYGGGSIDAIVVLGARTADDIQPLLEGQAETPLVTLSYRDDATAFGTINIRDTHISSLSELTLELIQELGVEIDKEIATQLFNGLTWGSKNFTSIGTSADTFKAAAELLSMGATRKQLQLQPQGIVPVRTQQPVQRPQQQRPMQQPKPQHRPPQQQSVPPQPQQQNQPPRPAQTDTSSSLREQLKAELRKELEREESPQQPASATQEPQLVPQAIEPKEEKQENILKPRIFNE